MQDNYAACAAFSLAPAQDGQPLHVTPNDPGGATAWGITQATYSRWIGRPATTDDMAGITQQISADILRAWYWHPVAGDVLPIGVDLMVFDHAVLGGGSASAKLLQRAVGFDGADVDGIIGPHTLAAVAEIDPAFLIGLVSDQQRSAYLSDDGAAYFARGWIARLDRRTQLACQMVGEAQAAAL